MTFRLPYGKLAVFVCLAAVGAGCSGSQTAQTQASAEASAPAGPIPTPTPDLNLLSYTNGTIVRSYPTALATDPAGVVLHGPVFKDGSSGPWQIVYEFPGVAHLGRIAVSLPGPDQNPPPSVTIAASTQAADAGFRDIAAFRAAANQTDPVVQEVGNVPARWLRLTVDGPAAHPFNAILAYGEIEPRPANAGYGGVYVQRGQPYDHGDGRFDPDPLPSDVPLFVRVVAAKGSTGGQYCTAEKASDAFPGPFDGRTWEPDHPESSRLVVNDDGSLIVGDIGGIPAFLVRSSANPTFCSAQDGGGNGPAHVLVLDGQTIFDQYPLGDYASNEPEFHFTRIAAGMFDSSVLGGYETVMLNGVCRPADAMPKGESDALLDWVRAGHRLLLLTAGVCGGGGDFGFLPYPFTAAAPAKKEPTGDVLTEVEGDGLGTLAATDTPHFLDPRVWTSSTNQIGNAYRAATSDPHWCGHLFASSTDQYDGFTQTYARYGRGLIVYDGFDHEDNDNASYQRMRRLELRADPDGEYPCDAVVALPFVVEPASRLTFTPGKARTVSLPMRFLPSGGWKGHVTLALSGAFDGELTPSDLTVTGDPVDFHAAIDIPANARASSYAVFVTADAGNGQKAQAAIVLENALPIAVQLKSQRRVRDYAIRFEPDSADLKSSSQAAIADVANVLRANAKWRLRVEVHTDSQGGNGAANDLSRLQARAIVEELVRRYHVKPKRLVAAGAGAAGAIASNATPAGRALNSRVELIRLADATKTPGRARTSTGRPHSSRPVSSRSATRK